MGQGLTSMFDFQSCMSPGVIFVTAYHWRHSNLPEIAPLHYWLDWHMHVTVGLTL